MKIAMAPVNIAGQPITLVNELRAQGVDIHLVQYTGRQKNHKFGYQSDKIINYNVLTRGTTQLQVLEDLLDLPVDIFHFWLRSLLFGGVYSNFTGLDIPIIKSFGRRIVYRFTGEDLRFKSTHIAKNPHNAYQYGYKTGIDEYKQRKYIDFISQYVDQFLVGDPELQEYFPAAKIIPRVIDVKQWDFIGACNKDCPIIVHAPSNPAVKGTAFVRKAISALQSAGFQFRYYEILNMNHALAKQLYQRADIVIDQLHIGWYGVLSLEALALGKTVVTYIREDLYENFEKPIPIINANPFTLQEKLKIVLKDFELRQELSLRARTYVEDVHDVKKVAAQLQTIYQEVKNKENSPQKIAPIVSYLDLQLNEYNQLPVLLAIIKGTFLNRLHTVYKKMQNILNPFYHMRKYKTKQFTKGLSLHKSER